MPNSVQSALVNPLEPSSCEATLLGPNALMPAGEIVDDPRDERRFRADHDELHRFLAEIDHRGVVGDVERHAFGFPRDAGIARRAPEFCHQGEAAIFHARACSRPPEPSRRICMGSAGQRFCRMSVARVPPRCKGELINGRHSGRRVKRADPESEKVGTAPFISGFRVARVASALE